MDLTVSFINPGYSLVRDSISSLALARLGWLQTIGFLAIGLLVEIFVAGLLFNIQRRRGFHLSIGLLVFVGFGMLLIGAFRTEPVGAPDTIEGTIHGLTATGVFWLFPIAILVLAPSLRKDPNWSGIFIYTLAAAVLGFVLVIITGVIQDDIGWFGLLERILVANIIIWVEAAAIKLLRLSLDRENR
jgi:hypothetical protein